ncbi:tyrosine-type recombinase/integrase [Kineosporia succinea]|uniref:Integrase n=1 Tax=Kineosporia succinea TaxID=84632 RepID=A0ABT9P5R0_9ACTN|nr:tyrosine-type recombinase/integrase [Kineosporia succinea]MDP9828024.1 integrase [Kineosporia succinea]
MTKSTWIRVTDAYREELLAAGGSPGSVRVRSVHLRKLERELEAAGYSSPLNATRQDLLSFMANSRWSPEYRRSIRSTVVGVYALAAADDMRAIPVNPADRLPRVRVPMGVPRPASDEQIEWALDRADERIWLAIMLGAVPGLRRAEIAGVHVDHLRAGKLWIKGKGGKEREVQVPRVIGDRIRSQAHPQFGWAFPNCSPMHPQFHGRHLSPDRIGHLVGGALPKGVTTHQLRHAAASYLHNTCGLSMEELRIVLGHASISTTQRYVRANTARADQALEGAATRFVRRPVLRSIPA